jgi:hypothetical protein
VLDLYRERAGPLSTGELYQALTFADVATTVLLDGQKQAPQGSPAAGLSKAAGYHSSVHQAQGMVMVQLDVTLAGALALLRAHAYSHELELVDVARDVVSRKLRLDAET